MKEQFFSKQAIVVESSWSQLKPMSRKLNKEKVAPILGNLFSTAFAEGYSFGKFEMKDEFDAAIKQVRDDLLQDFGTDVQTRERIREILEKLNGCTLPW